MALPGKENPFAKGLTEKAPVPGLKPKKSFVKIPLSTGAYSPAPEVDAPNSARPTDGPIDQAIAVYAIAEIATPPNREPVASPSRALAEHAIAGTATAKNTTAAPTIESPAIADTTVARSGDKKATKVEYAIAKTAIADLADKRGGYTRVDNYVFDVLMPKIGSAPAGIVYLYLWRRSLGFQRLSVSLSHQIIADAVGLSKRTVQEAVARLNELNVVRTHRAYETAIPEHFILRPWTAAKEPAEETDTTTAIADSTTANDAVAKISGTYSSDYPTAIAEAATIKRKLNKETKKTLSQADVPESWDQFTAQLTEKARERAERVFQSLRTQFPNDQVDELAECPRNLERFGAPDGTPWGQISSPIGLMESSWPQLREFFRKRESETQKANHARERIEADQIKGEEQERREAKESQQRREAFFATFPDEQGRREAIQKYLAGLPFNSEGMIGQGIAIGKWWDDHHSMPTQIENDDAEKSSPSDRS